MQRSAAASKVWRETESILLSLEPLIIAGALLFSLTAMAFEIADFSLAHSHEILYLRDF